MKSEQHVVNSSNSSKVWQNQIIILETRKIIPVSSFLLFFLFFAEPPPKRLTNLSQKELNQLVEQRQSVLGGESKIKWSLLTFRGWWCIVRFLQRFFQQFNDVSAQAFIAKLFYMASTSGEQELYARVVSNFCFKLCLTYEFLFQKR